MTMNTEQRHSCKMPWRRGRWKNRVYICNCGTGWTAKYYNSAPLAEVPPPGYYLWHPVALTVGEPVYLHG